jgi:hypothetical protein
MFCFALVMFSTIVLVIIGTRKPTGWAMAICRKKIATKTGKKTQFLQFINYFSKIADLPNFFSEIQIQIQHLKFGIQPNF